MGENVSQSWFGSPVHPPPLSTFVLDIPFACMGEQQGPRVSEAQNGQPACFAIALALMPIFFLCRLFLPHHFPIYSTWRYCHLCPWCVFPRMMSQWCHAKCTAIFGPITSSTPLTAFWTSWQVASAQMGITRTEEDQMPFVACFFHLFNFKSFLSCLSDPVHVRQGGYICCPRQRDLQGGCSCLSHYEVITKAVIRQAAGFGEHPPCSTMKK